jgi:hypothetical protein
MMVEIVMNRVLAKLGDDVDDRDGCMIRMMDMEIRGKQQYNLDMDLVIGELVCATLMDLKSLMAPLVMESVMMLAMEYLILQLLVILDIHTLALMLLAIQV